MKLREKNTLFKIADEIQTARKHKGRNGQTRKHRSKFYDNGFAIDLHFNEEFYTPSIHQANTWARAETFYSEESGVDYEVEEFEEKTAPAVTAKVKPEVSQTPLAPVTLVHTEQKIPKPKAPQPALGIDIVETSPKGPAPPEAETKQENEDQAFEDELRALLSGQKKPEVAEQKSTKETADDQQTGQAEHPHSVFDAMGKQLAFANTFDLGSVQLEKQLDELDQQLDRSESADRKSPLIDFKEPVHLDELDIAQDFEVIDQIKSQQLKPPEPVISEAGQKAQELNQPGKETTCYPVESKKVESDSDKISQSDGQSIAQALSSTIPLDPEKGGQSVSIDALQIGDIILSTTKQPVSAVIRTVTNSPVSHTILYIGDGQVVEAIQEGVVMRTLDEAIKDATVAVAFRHPLITEEQAFEIRDFAGQKIGKSYDHFGIVKQALFQLNKSVYCIGKSGKELEKCKNWFGKIYLGTDNNDVFFCSELVLAAYEHAGLPLTNTPPHWNTTQDIAELRLNSRLGYIGHLKTP